MVEAYQRCADLVSQLPHAIRAKATVAGATSWIDDLPQHLADLEQRWEITLGPILHGGTEAFVANAVLHTSRGRSTAAVFKLPVPHGERIHDEATVLELANGDGCPKLFQRDRANGAMLMERLGSPLVNLGLPIARRLDILTQAASRLWRPAPESGLTTGADKGRWLVEMIPQRWEQLDQPCSERAVAHAVACGERRINAHDDERAMLVHGDVHQWNALQANGGFKLVDPDGLLAEPEYDLGILMREDPVQLMMDDPRVRSRRLAKATGLDENAIWEWGVIERVSTGLVLAEIDLQPVGAQILAAADAIAAGERPL